MRASDGEYSGNTNFKDKKWGCWLTCTNWDALLGFFFFRMALSVWIVIVGNI